jgi:hypothetical protein
MRINDIASGGAFWRTSKPPGACYVEPKEIAVMSSTYVWQYFYQLAILETNHSRRPLLIRAARAAIDVRIEQLRSDANSSIEEREAIAEALVSLRALKQDLSA